MSNEIRSQIGLTSRSVHEVLRPRWSILLCAFGSSVVGIALTPLSAHWSEVAGYVAGLVGLIALVVFRFLNRKRQMDRNYVPDTRIGPVALATVAVALAAVVLNAYGLSQRVVL